MTARISSRSFVGLSTKQIKVSSLSNGILSTRYFHESIGTDVTRTRDLFYHGKNDVGILAVRHIRQNGVNTENDGKTGPNFDVTLTKNSWNVQGFC